MDLSSPPTNDPMATNLRGRIPSPPYGYHNSFHTHAVEANPPTYSEVIIPNPPVEDEEEIPILPGYDCTIENEAPVYLRCEFFDPFTECPDNRWRMHYAVLEGTKLSLFPLKPNKTAAQLKARKPLHTFSLQHAEVGLAVDLPPEEPVAKCPLIEALPSSVRQRWIATKPHLFGPKHEWILRLRLESFQILLSYASQTLMLDWVEDFCAAIDISQPLEDRTYPRYRSLPRRSRRQRQLENMYRADSSQMAGLEALGERLIQQQQRIINSMYPNLGDESRAGDRSSVLQPTTSNQPLEPVLSRDPDVEDLDPSDARESPYDAEDAAESTSSELVEPAESSKPAFWSRPLHSQSVASLIRYRRRCAPIMNRYSPRSSDIIFHRGKRARIDAKRERLVQFELAPPRYPKATKSKESKLPTIDENFTERFLNPGDEVDRQSQIESSRPIASVFAEDSPNLSKDASLPVPKPPTTTNIRLSSSSTTTENDIENASVRSFAALTIASSREATDPVSMIATGASSFMHERTQDEIEETAEEGEDLTSQLKEKQSRNVVENPTAEFVRLVL